MKQNFFVFFLVFSLVSFMPLFCSALFENNPISNDKDSEVETYVNVGQLTNVTFQNALGYGWYVIYVSDEVPKESDYSVINYPRNVDPQPIFNDYLEVSNGLFDYSIISPDKKHLNYSYSTIKAKKAGIFYIIYAFYRVFEPPHVRQATYATIKVNAT